MTGPGRRGLGTRRNARLTLAAHELGVQQKAQSSDYDGVRGVRQTSLQLGKADRAIRQTR